MIVAGPVFAEWYWGPFFFALFFGPFILAGAAVLTWILARHARRRGRPLTWPKLLTLLLGLIAGISLLVLGSLSAKAWIEESRLSASQSAVISGIAETTTRS